MTRLRVLTLNIWNCQGPWRKRRRLIRRELQQLAPDIVGLQEVMHHEGDIDQAQEVAAGLGYHVVFEPASTLDDGTRFGNAVLSRFPVVTVNSIRLPGGETDEPRALLHVAVEAPYGRVPFFVTHLDWEPDHGPVRVTQVAAIIGAIDALAPPGEGFPAVLVGDLNAEADSDEVRLLGAAGGIGGSFVDCFAAAGDGTAGYTYARSNRYAAEDWERNQRIDYIFARPDAARRGEPLVARLVCTASNGSVFPSDHYGVYAELAATPTA
jgi:endonuclease/exonuclease/phosphatase family metal-dependent hydrolase